MLMELTDKYEVIVIGSGPGGYVAALRAARLGKKVLLVEKDRVGGVCLNAGCIPTKSLIDSVQKFSSISELKKMGVRVDLSDFSYEYLYKKSQQAAKRLSKSVEYLFKKNSVMYVNDTASFNSQNSISLSSGKIIEAENIIIATGSVPRGVKGFNIDEKRIISSNGALRQTSLPDKIAILGSGVVGIEFAYIYNELGVEVHLIELQDQLLPNMDKDVSAELAKIFSGKKIKLYLSAQAELLKYENSDRMVLEINSPGQDKQQIEVDKILVATGRKPYVENLGLEKTGIKLENGFIPVDENYQTKLPGIYAIGDVINTPQLAHVASKEGELVAEYICGHLPLEQVNYDNVPFAIYSDPQIAFFGRTEIQLQKEGVKYAKEVYPYRGCGKAVAVGKTDGFIKVIYDPQTKRIISAAIIGYQATELIHELLLVKNYNLDTFKVATMIHAHPTISEIVMEVLKVIHRCAVHI
jgi:dihydrolipoamide dehydrogenase